MRTFRAGMLAGFAATLLSAAGTAPVEAKDICGWYVIISCTTDETAADEVVNKGWGGKIDTNKYVGLKHGLFCVVSGPQPKASAWSDRAAAIGQGFASADAYIKEACTDERNVGD